MVIMVALLIGISLSCYCLFSPDHKYPKLRWAAVLFLLLGFCLIAAQVPCEKTETVKTEVVSPFPRTIRELDRQIIDWLLPN